MVFIYLFLLGITIGSFLNVLIDRLPQEKSILGRSHCDYCKKTLEPVDLIPVFSFIFLKGKCRRCHKKLSWQYPAIELLTGGMFVFLTYVFQPTIFNVVPFIGYLGFFSALLVIFFADLKYHLIPDSMQVALLICSAVFLFPKWEKMPINLIHYLWAGLVVASPVLFLFAVTRGRGMGFGDVKLAFVFGFALGILGGFVGLYLAFIIGATVGIILLIGKRKKLKSQIAFGPYIIIGCLIFMAYSDLLTKFVHRFLGF